MPIIGTGAIDLQTDNGEALDITPFVRRFVWRESMIQGGWSWELRFAAEQWDEWTDFQRGKATSKFQLRLRNQEDDASTTTPWRRAYVDSSRDAFRGLSMASKISGGDIRLDMMQKARTRAFPDATVSQVIEKIASEWNLDTTAVVDTTPHRTRYQLREDDWSFLQRLALDAANATGRADTFLWLSDDATLHFDSPDLQSPSVREHNMADVENRVDRIIVNYNGRSVDRAGGAMVRRVGYDFDNLEAVSFTFDANAATSQPALARRVPRDPANGLRVYPVAEESQAFAEDAARAQWGSVGPRYYSLKLATRPDLALHPGGCLTLLNKPGPRQLAPVFGRYAILEVTHTLTQASIITTALCYRREADDGEADPTGAPVEETGTTDNYTFGQEQQAQIVIQAEAIEEGG